MIIYIHTYVYDYQGGSVVKNLPAKQKSQVISLGQEFPGIPGSPGEGNSNSLQYSCLDNPTNRGA